MSRPCSIPETLAPSILSRWVNGQSSGQIVEWIHSTNHRRKAETQTSKSSVLRFVEHYSRSEVLGSRVPLVRRCRAEAHLMMDGLQEVEDGIRHCIAEADTLDAKPESSKRFYSKLRSLGDLERNCFRRIKLAGIDGKTDIHREEERDQAIVALDARLRAESKIDLAEDLGQPVPELPPAELPRRIESTSSGETREKQTNGCWEFREDSMGDIHKDIAELRTIMARKNSVGAIPKRTAPAMPPPRPAADAYPPDRSVDLGVPPKQKCFRLGRDAQGRRDVPDPRSNSEQKSSTPPPVNAAPMPKVGRNEPCPCGSKIKWKKCHGGPNPPASKAA